jgi:hypothetical protein
VTTVTTVTTVTAESTVAAKILDVAR